MVVAAERELVPALCLEKVEAGQRFRSPEELTLLLLVAGVVLVEGRLGFLVAGLREPMPLGQEQGWGVLNLLAVLDLLEGHRGMGLVALSDRVVLGVAMAEVAAVAIMVAAGVQILTAPVGLAVAVLDWLVGLVLPQRLEAARLPH